MNDEAENLVQVPVLAERTKTRTVKQWFQHVRVPDLVSPKSAFQGHKHALPIDSEVNVLQEILVTEPNDGFP